MTRGRRVFLVGAGESLRGFDFSRLRDKDTMAVNMSALDVPDPTYCVTADSSIFRRIQEGYFKDVKTAWVLVTNEAHCSMKWRDGKFVHKNGFVYNLFCVSMLIRNAGVEGIGFSFDDFRTGYNSGFCALQLAVLLGYEKIYLLGFDMRGKYYHDKYGDKKIRNKTFDKFYDNFVTALSVLKERRPGVEVVSCSHTSRLNEIIRYMPFETICRRD